MKPFKKIAMAVLAASVAGTALTSGLSAYAQSGVANGNGGQTTSQAITDQRMAHMGERGGWGRGHGKRGREQAKRLFERFDTDEDGVITEAEISAVQAEDFATADTDANGEISLEEFKAAFLERSNDRMVRAFQFMDRDGDGAVTQEEADRIANRMFGRLDRDGNDVIERVRGQRGENAENSQRADAGERGGREHRSMRGGRGGQARMVMGLFDTDGNGSVTREEFDAKRAELFALADTNGSGSFTLDDFSPLWLAVNDARIVDMFQRADADGSLAISAEERDQAKEQMLNRADRNGDGVISKADFKRGKKGKRGEGRDRG